MMKLLLVPALSLSLPAALPALAEESPWQFSGAAGLAFSGGNSDSVAYSLQFLGSYMRDGNTAYLGLDHFYAKNGGVESSDSLKVFSQYSHDLGERWYLGGYGSYFQDDIAGIDYRLDANVLLGFHAINRDRMKLSFEAGPGYAWEKQGGSASDFATLRLAERFEYKFSATSKFWQSLSWTPRVDDFAD